MGIFHEFIYRIYLSICLLNYVKNGLMVKTTTQKKTLPFRLGAHSAGHVRDGIDHGLYRLGEEIVVCKVAAVSESKLIVERIH